MEKSVIKLSEITKHETNPFVVELRGKMYLQPRANTIIARGQSIVDMTTGEVVDEGILIGKRKIVDKSQFAKIYASEIGKLYELSKCAQNVFLYLTKVMDYDNKAFFNYLSDFKKIGYNTKKSPYSGITELIQRNIIAPAIMPHYYWLNPSIVCKGERFAKYVEYVIGQDGEEVKKQAMLKEQGKNLTKALPSEAFEKVKKAQKTQFIDGKLFPEHPNPYSPE